MNIVEIARKFSVSPVTVSNALNYRKGVAEALARQIRDYAGSIGYQPNYLARSLLSGRTGTIGVCLCVPPATPWFCNLLSQLQHRLAEENYYANTIIINPFESGDRLQREKWALNFFRQIKTEAILFGPLDVERFSLLRRELTALPRLVVFDALETLPVPHVGLDMSGSCEMAMQYLFQAGHRQIGYLGLNHFDATSPSPYTRYARYRDFLARHGLPFQPDWVIHTPRLLPEPTMLADLKRLLLRPDRVSAFFCHDDSFAMLAFKAAAECGRRIPEDLALISFDNQPSAWLANPGLSSIYFDLDDYIDHLLEITLELLNASPDSPPPLRQHRATAKLAERESIIPLAESQFDQKFSIGS
ncbi:LacI family DNA-binding transcriptional regulator [Victivallis sp. Marseille-Q1083]|uniref:LacI family DNA-binding transcriptional regulator n=1 Tax=Victivallis sp. Marseille-Q1083 TaxID=2717288 RepID=UPI00158EF7F8|nr:LacI family DNA-binding transcriptional regulator [Victivallis sp. Marseille-Q1083]